MKKSVLAAAVAAFMVTAALAGCSGNEPLRSTTAAPPNAADPDFGHVHGLGVNPADRLLYAATHSGVWVVPTGGRPLLVAGRHQDTMGFTIAGPDHFLGSGHPDLRENLPSHLGLIESRDRAKTWQHLSLLGRADFHDLAARHGQIYGYDSTSSTLMVSADGRTWRRLAQLDLYDFTVAPAQPHLVLATGERGVLRSTDGGKSFTALPGAPHLRFVDWSAAGLYGLDQTGTVWVSPDRAATWVRRGELGSPPQALTVTEAGQLLAADQDGIVTSEDGGRGFRPVLSYGTAGHG
jgi:hypothetical protein